MRTLVVTFLLLLSSIPLDAQVSRRRAAAGQPANPATGGNNCFTFGLVRPGLEASYIATSPSGSSNFTVTWISDQPTKTRTTQRVVTPQATSDVETTLDGEIVGNLRALKHIYVKTTTAVPFIGSVVAEVDVDFVPSLAAGPAEGWCTGATWDVPPSTQTIVSRSIAGQQTVVNTTTASTGEVLAVGESITVPAGTFNTVKFRSVIASGSSLSPAITWTSMDHAIVVKQEAFDSAGNVTTTTTLQSMR